MDQTREEQIEELKKMKVPDLQAMFEEIVGEPTKAPNKVFLAKKIIEALEKKGEAAVAKPKGKATKKQDSLRDLSIDKLRDRYAEIVGRPTGSSNKEYMIWKIKQAQAGKIRVGPPLVRQRSDADFKVLPVRLEAEVVDVIDEAWRRQGLKTRMDLFRHAISDYMLSHGEKEAAAAILPSE